MGDLHRSESFLPDVPTIGVAFAVGLWGCFDRYSKCRRLLHKTTKFGDVKQLFGRGVEISSTIYSTHSPLDLIVIPHGTMWHSQVVAPCVISKRTLQLQASRPF